MIGNHVRDHVKYLAALLLARGSQSEQVDELEPVSDDSGQQRFHPIDSVVVQQAFLLVVCRGFSAVDCDGSGVPRKAHRRSHTSSVRQGGATPRGASMPSRTRANKPTTHH